MPKLLPFLPLFDEPPDGPSDESPEFAQIPQPTAPLLPESSPSAQPPDAEARAQALDIRRSFIVEAPAGSGKTGLLIQRFLKLLADESVTSPEQVLAITFTLKATAEMRDRVLAHLEAARPNPNAGNLPVASDFASQTRALAQSVLERDRLLGWDLLNHPYRLNLRTIDSVCAEIARTLPVLSGSGGRLAPATDAQPLYREAARRTLLLLGSPSPADAAFDTALRDLLLHRDGNLADCETLLADMLSLRDQWGALIPLTHPQLDDAWLDANVLPRLQLALEQAICAGLTPLAEAFPPGVLDELAELAGHLGHLDGYRGELSPIAHCAGIHTAPIPIAGHREHWNALVHLLTTKDTAWRKRAYSNDLKFQIQKHQAARLTAIVDSLSHRDDLIPILESVRSLPAAQYPPAQWALAKSLFRVLSRALVELQIVFTGRGECDFTELSLLAQAALGTDSGADDLAAALGARLQHLLVDEMQDTSAGQYDLIESLTASWDGHSQTVFLVGDPRQSIYLFRQARVERFLGTMLTQRLGDLPLTHLRLTANFRSQQTLVDQFNRDFSLVFPMATTSAVADQFGALPYTRAEATLRASPYAVGLTWHTNPLSVSQTALPHGRTAAQIRQRQARRDARDIRRTARRWLDKPLPASRKIIRDEAGREIPEPWRIAVLVRSRNHLAEIVAEFDDDRLGRIPYRAVEITPLNERQEILDLTALTRALLHPADRVAWLAILRAPWCGLRLADLHILAGADGSSLKDVSIQRLIAERGQLLGEESCLRLQRVWTVMSEAATKRAHLTVSQLVERAWRSLGGDGWLAESEIINVRRYFQLLDEMESSGGPIDPALLDGRLQRLYAEPNSIPFGKPFVELLTIHKAKGLEWDVVFVPALERSPGINRSRLLTWSQIESADSSTNEAAPILLAPIAARGEEVDALTAWIKGIYREREAAERKRLFYVAATRAREEVHLFAAPDLSANGEIRPRWDSLLKAAWAAAQPHFTLAFAPSTEAGAPSRIPSEMGSSEPYTFDIAASADPVPSHTPYLVPTIHESAYPTVQRVPLTYSPAARFAAARAHRLPYAEPGPLAGTVQFTRPEGSFAARIFGTAIHSFLEILTNRLAAGVAPGSLLAELPTWTPRISAVLRAEGVPSAALSQTAARVRTVLEATIRDPNGLWLVSPHPNAATEFALTAPSHASKQLASVRVDRLFHAGPEPHSPGDRCLWIVDYKTSSHGQTDLDEFLASERATYAPQLETYARILAQSVPNPASEVRLALYYPTFPRLLWWNPKTN